MKLTNFVALALTISSASGKLLRGNHKCFSADFNTENTNTADAGLTGIPYTAATGSGTAIVEWDIVSNTYSLKAQIEQLSEEPATNKQIIGWHLHAGNAQAQNGAIVTVFCMSAPLPTPDAGQNVVCPQSHTVTIPALERDTMWAKPGLFVQAIANATNPTKNTFASTPQEMANGTAPMGQSVLNSALQACTSEEDCNIYVNMHTNYSFTANRGAALGLARGQLKPVPC